MAYTAEQLIKLLHLVPHQEGGRYAFCDNSSQELPFLPAFNGTRNSCSYIYYMLQKGEISRWHKLKATEIWTWHQGGSLLMTLGGEGDLPAPERSFKLGPKLESGEQFQQMVPQNRWQTTRVIDGDFVLVSCIVSPAYTDEDCYLPPQPLTNEIYS